MAEPPSAEEAAKTKEERIEAVVVAALQRADQRIALEREVMCQLHDDDMMEKEAIIYAAVQLFVQKEALGQEQQAQRLAHLRSYIQRNKSSMDIPWLNGNLWNEYLEETVWKRQQMTCPITKRQAFFDDLAIQEIYWNDEVVAIRNTADAARKAFEIASLPQPVSFICNICSASFLSKTALLQHLPECQQLHNEQRQQERETQQQEREKQQQERDLQYQQRREEQIQRFDEQYQRRQQQSDEQYTQRQQQIDELRYLNSESAKQIQQLRQARLELAIASSASLATTPTAMSPVSLYSRIPTHPPKPRICTRCDDSFPSSTALHKHLADCKAQKKGDRADDWRIGTTRA